MKTRNVCKLLVLSALLLAPHFALGVVYTWDDSSSDHLWTNSLNWTNNSGYPAAAPDDTTFDDTQVGTVIIDTDIGTDIMLVSHTAGTNTYQISAGKTFSVASWRQAFILPLTNSVAIEGGTFQPSVMYVAYKSSAGGTIYPTAYLTITNSVFDTANLSTLYVGYDSHSVGAAIGELDASGASIKDGSVANSMSLTTLGVGRHRAGGTLSLPPAVTNIDVGTLYLGSWYNVDYHSYLDLGQEPQLEALTISTFAQIGRGNFRYRDSVGTNHVGLPPNITVKIGEAGSPADFRMAYMYNSPGTDVRWSGFKRFEAYFSTLYIGYNGNSMTAYGELDLTSTNTTELVGDFTSTEVNTPFVRLGGKTGPATGILKVPRTVTNMTFGTLDMGRFDDLSGGDYSALNVGSNSQLHALQVTDYFRMGRGRFESVDNLGVTNNRLPGGVAVTIGSATNRAYFNLGAASSIATLVEFGVGVGSFEAYLTDFIVSKERDAWFNHYVTSTLDLRGATVTALDIDGEAVIGHYGGARSSVYLPRCTMSCSNLTVGRVGSGTPTYDNTWFARFYPSNAAVTVQNTATIEQSGTLYSTIDGYSSGIDLATTNLTVATPHPTTGIYGLIDLTFKRDPLISSPDYWGLRLKGNATNYLQSLTGAVPARLTWDISGLSAKNQARFGIIYDADDDVTYVGIEGIPGGTFILIQ